MKPLFKFFAFQIVLMTCFLFAASAFAQTPNAPQLTTMTMAVMIINIVVGFLGQGVGQGNVLGIVTVPKIWVPYLTVVIAFGSSVATALSQGDSVLLSILLALGGLATGTALAHHVGTPARTMSMTEANDGKPPASVKAPAGNEVIVPGGK